MMIETLDIAKWNLMEINAMLMENNSVSDDIVDSINKCIIQISEVYIMNFADWNQKQNSII